MIQFTDGKAVATDALICSIGWSFVPDIKFLPESQHLELGIPSTRYTKSQKELWAKLNARADVEILNRYPQLREGPRLEYNSLSVRKNLSSSLQEQSQRQQEECTPWRLWRGIVPPLMKEKNLVFLGIVSNLQGAITNEIGGLWAYAYLNGELDGVTRGLSVTRPRDGESKNRLHDTLSHIGNEKENGIVTDEQSRLLYETAIFNRFGYWRYPCGYAVCFPDFVFDGIPFFDLLLQDLGWIRWRKGWGWLGEIFGGPSRAGRRMATDERWAFNLRYSSFWGRGEVGGRI